MANYYCSSRTNYFQVKDVPAFQTWAKQRGVETCESFKHAEHYALFPNPSDDAGAFPNYDHETDTEVDFAAELAAHLATDSVAVILEAGAEKLRYIHGHAVAINAQGARVELALDNIYDLAKLRLGATEVTRAEY